MRKKKKIKTIIVEKFNYNHEHDYGVNMEPALLLKLLEFAHEEATSDEQLHSIVSKAHVLAHEKDCLWMDDYHKLVSETIPHHHMKEDEEAYVVVTTPIEEAMATQPAAQ